MVDRLLEIARISRSKNRERDFEIGISRRRKGRGASAAGVACTGARTHDRRSLDLARRSASTKLGQPGRSVSTITRTSYYLRRRFGVTHPQFSDQGPHGQGSCLLRNGEAAEGPARPFRSEIGDPDVVGYSLQGEPRRDRRSETTGHHRERRSVVLELRRVAAGPSPGPGEALERAGVSWKVYQNAQDNYGDNGLAYSRRYTGHIETGAASISG
jgi:hypothetical protein